MLPLELLVHICSCLAEPAATRVKLLFVGQPNTFLALRPTALHTVRAGHHWAVLLLENAGFLPAPLSLELMDAVLEADSVPLYRWLRWKRGIELPLAQVASHGSVAVLRSLYEATVSKQDTQQALCSAVKAGQVEAASFLLQKGSFTRLAVCMLNLFAVAALEGQLDCILMLLRHFDLQPFMVFGNNPFDLNRRCWDRGHWKIVRWLAGQFDCVGEDIRRCCIHHYLRGAVHYSSEECCEWVASFCKLTKERLKDGFLFLVWHLGRTTLQGLSWLKHKFQLEWQDFSGLFTILSETNLVEGDNGLAMLQWLADNFNWPHDWLFSVGPFHHAVICSAWSTAAWLVKTFQPDWRLLDHDHFPYLSDVRRQQLRSLLHQPAILSPQE